MRRTYRRLTSSSSHKASSLRDESRESLPDLKSDSAPLPLCANGVVLTRGVFTLGPISIGVQPGRLTCLVGPNGSGKTTLLRVLLGLLKVDEGECLVGTLRASGRPPATIRHVGYVPDEADNVIPELTVHEMWNLYALAHVAAGRDSTKTQALARRSLLRRAEEFASWLDFTPAPVGPMSSFSHGMTKKAQLVAALLHDPSVIVLDEPRNGLDPIAIERLEQLIEGLVAAGRTVLVATHDLRFAERLADDLVILHRGRVRYAGPCGEAIQPGETLVEAFFRHVSSGPASTEEFTGVRDWA